MERSTSVSVLCATPVESLSDAELLAGTRRLVGRSNQLLAELLAHLAEVEARKIHRLRACASLYTYCIYELRFSEDEAFRRVAAARLVTRFPRLLSALATGELHLTGLLMLGPHLTEANLVEVLARAKHRTKRELGRLVRMLDPLPEVPARIEPLGPAPARLARAPSWGQFMEALSPTRHLPAGDRPRDWADGAAVGSGAEGAPGGGVSVEERASVEQALEGPSVHDASTDGWSVNRVAAEEGARGEGVAAGGAFVSDGVSAGGVSVGSVANDASADHASLASAPARVEPGFERDADASAGGSSADAASVQPSGANPDLAPTRVRLQPERYKVQFTATEEYVRLIDEAKALLSHAAPRVTLEELHLRAVRALVSELRKRKYATTGARFERAGGAGPTPQPQSGDASDSAGARGAQLPPEEPIHPRRRGRHIPAAVRRAVFERDGQRCTYSDAWGKRCDETHLLEFHHVEPFAAGGGHTASNLTVRCRAHNALAAEDEFGRELIESKREMSPHEPLATP